MNARVALVTGGTRGIGAAISLALKNAGRTVIASYDSNEDAAEQFRTQTKIHTQKFEVTDPAACAASIRAVESRVGPIDVLVNNAGICQDAPISRLTPQMWDEVISTNLTAAFTLCRLVWPGMIECQFGRIVNISSVNALTGQYGQANYAAAKAGLLGLTKSLAKEGAKYHITVNALAPGYIETDMTASLPAHIREKIIAGIPLGRLGQPEEIARGAVFLTADEAEFITGTTLSINGGQRND